MKTILTSPTARKIYLLLTLLTVLFVICNNVLFPWYVNQGAILTVPTVVGMSFDDARRYLDSLGFESKKGDVRMDREHAAGVVIAQNPQDGSRVKKGRRIYLTVSGGELQVVVPNVRGRTLRDATFALEKEGLKLGGVEYANSDEFPANTVIEQKIASGTKVKRDVYVSVVVSQGSSLQKIPVPDVTGKTLAEATSALVLAGLRVGNITHVPSADLLPNTIVDQYPRVGEMVAAGQAIDLFVVQGSRSDVPGN